MITPDIDLRIMQRKLMATSILAIIKTLRGKLRYDIDLGSIEYSVKRF